MSTPESHDRLSARLLLGNALADGRPIRPEVREALNRLLDVLALSDDADYDPDVGVEGIDERTRADGWQASAWRASVTRFRALLTEVRAEGVSAGSREVTS